MTEYDIKPKRSNTSSFRSILIHILKFLISFLLIYEGWYIEKFGPISRLLQILAVLIVFFTFLSNFGRKREKNSGNLIGIFWILFGVIAFIVGLYVRYTDVVNESLSTYFSFLAICFCVGSIAQYNFDKWLPNMMIIITFLCAISATFFGYSYVNGGYVGITMSANNNPNTLGIIMSIGVYYLLMPIQKQSMWKWIVRIVLVGVFLNVIVNTGSRSAVLCLATVVGLSTFFHFKFLRGSDTSRLLKRFFMGFACVIIVFLSLHYIQTISSGTSGINRLLDNFHTEAYGGRSSLYAIAIKIFLRKPIFGVGYNGFSIVSNLNYYSHSTYMELLSCTGIVGFLLFLIPVAKGIKDSIKYIRIDQGRSLTLLFLLVVDGFFGIIFYNMVVMILLYWTIISMNKMIKERANDQIDRH